MASVFDVAAYILRRTGPITTMKLEKLCYYSQAWNLVWDETPLFPERFEAWANGPVCPELYRSHRGLFRIAPNDLNGGNPDGLTKQERDTVDAVLEFYGPLGAYQLSELTHHERPWLDARGDLAPGEPGSTEITFDSMAEYYGSLTD